jgi:hypothetical protein
LVGSGESVTPTQFEDLLARCERGKATEADLAELRLALDTQEDTFREALTAFRGGLREEVGSVDLVSPVMEQLLADEVAVDDALGALSDGLRQEAMGFDIADAVLATVEDPKAELSALADGEVSVAARRRLAVRLGEDVAARLLVSDFVETGRVLRSALRSEVADSGFEGVWQGVAEAIGIEDSEAVPGWEPVAELLREALSFEAGTADVADRVMDSLDLSAAVERAPQPEISVATAPAKEPARPRSFLPAALATGLAAALVLIWTTGPVEPPTVESVPVEVAANDFADTGLEASDGDAYAFAEINEAQIEDLEVAEDAMVHVFSLGDGSPTVIFLDEHAYEDEELTEQDEEGATL